MFQEVGVTGALVQSTTTRPLLTVAETPVGKEQKIFGFEIHFQPNITKFEEREFGKDFQRALEQASLFGNAVVVIRGHADPMALAAVKRVTGSTVARLCCASKSKISPGIGCPAARVPSRRGSSTCRWKSTGRCGFSEVARPTGSRRVRWRAPTR